MISFNEYQGYFAQISGIIFLIVITVMLFSGLHSEQPIIIQLIFFLSLICSFMLIIFGSLIVRIVKRKKQALRVKQ